MHCCLHRAGRVKIGIRRRAVHVVVSPPLRVVLLAIEQKLYLVEPSNAISGV